VKLRILSAAGADVNAVNMIAALIAIANGLFIGALH